MKPINVAEDIIPIGEFKAQASAVLRKLRKTGRPVVVTQSGRPAAVVLSTAEYERLAERDRFIAAVQQGLDEAEAGRVLDHEQVMAAVERELAGGSRSRGKTRQGPVD